MKFVFVLQVGANGSVTVNENSSAVISQTSLHIINPHIPPTDIVYTLVRPPKHGYLAIDPSNSHGYYLSYFISLFLNNQLSFHPNPTNSLRLITHATSSQIYTQILMQSIPSISIPLWHQFSILICITVNVTCIPKLIFKNYANKSNIIVSSVLVCRNDCIFTLKHVTFY